jgi:MscS family membrane protein
VTLDDWRRANPLLSELLLAALILAAAYVAARLVSWVLERALTRAKDDASPGVERRLALALRGPLTSLLFLFGVWAAVHRAPLPFTWMVRVDALLFACGVLLAALLLLRSWSVGLDWYVKDTNLGRGDRLASEFAPLFNKVGRVFIVLVALITLLQHLGVDVASLVVSLGVGSLALGLAAQDTLANMFAGFTLMLDRPFRVGDRIQLSTGEVGDVLYIGMRATQIKTLDEAVLVVPNSVLVKDRLINHSEPSRAMVGRIDATLAWGADLDRARAILLEAASAAGVAADPPPIVLVSRFGDIGLQVQLVYHVADYTAAGRVKSEIQDVVYRRFAESGISMAMRYDPAERKPGGAA